MLSPKLLAELREHWRRLRKKPSVWLFPGQQNHCADHPIELMRQSGMNVEEFTSTADRKAKIVTGLAVTFEQKKRSLPTEGRALEGEKKLSVIRVELMYDRTPTGF